MESGCSATYLCHPSLVYAADYLAYHTAQKHYQEPGSLEDATDYKNKTVLKGGEVLKLKELLQFQSKTERLHRMDEYIDAMLEDNPDLTTRELNRMLRRQFGTHISKGRIAYGDDFINLKEYQLRTLKANDLQAWMNAHPELEHQSPEKHSHTHGIEATQQQQPDNHHRIRKPANIQGGSRDQNRKWEVLGRAKRTSSSGPQLPLQ